MMEKLPRRKGNRLSGYDYSTAGYYFVTVCAEDMREWFGKIVGYAPPRVLKCELSEHGLFVDTQIQKIDSIYSDASIDKYVIMPNHIHMIIVIKNETRRGAFPTKALMPQIMQSLKSMTTRRFGINIWQKSYYDHIIQSEKEYKKIAHYIDGNPQTWANDRYYSTN